MVAVSSAHSTSRAQTNAQVIADSRVPECPSIFVLGCLEKRVTLYSQQVRALNLVSALVDEGIVKAKSKVAIVGGGGAGLTAAAALAVTVPNLKLLDLYERKPDLLHLQLKSPHRHLHPHLYDWPAEGSLRIDAGLPLLNWSAGTAEEVATQIIGAFDHISEASRLLRVKRQHPVERVQSFPLGGCRVHVAENPLAGDFYDVVLLSIGFGNEHLTDGETNHSYWDATLLSGPFRGHAAEYKILVSGNGDGGLVDFVTAAFSGKSQQEIYEYITSRSDLGETKRVLLEIEEEAWKPGSDLDIYAEYKRRLPSTLPSGIWLDMSSKLRRDAKVLLHTRTNHLFRRDTAILNRFATYLAITADQNTEQFAFRAVTGFEISGSPLGKRVTFKDGSYIDPTHRCLRFGPDITSNFQPFQEHIDAVAADRNSNPGGYRPATPLLTESAVARFGAAGAGTVAAAPVGPSVTEEIASGPKFLAIALSLAQNGQAVWSSPIPASEARRVWADDAPELALTCYMTPDEAGPLRFVVARLISHARAYRLFCRDSHAWVDFLREFVGGARPGPNVEVRFKVRASSGEPDLSAATELVSHYELASRVHLSLDFDVLERLHTLVGKCLHASRPMQMGWPLEAKLRETMRMRWQDWYNKLLSSEAKRRRFLVLLGSPDDDTDVGVAGLVRVGPRCVEPHLLRATLFALSFAVCTDTKVDPTASFPGNLVGERLSAHALGVSWLDGVDIGPDVGSRRWSTSLVLLSELREVPLHQSHLPRLDHNPEGKPSITHVPPHEQPFIVGCSHQAQLAMRRGESAVRAHFNSLLRERALAAAAMLE